MSEFEQEALEAVSATPRCSVNIRMLQAGFYTWTITVSDGFDEDELERCRLAAIKAARSTEANLPFGPAETPRGRSRG